MKEYLEPAVKLLFEIVTRDVPKDIREAEQMLAYAQELITAIRQLEDIKKSFYEKLGKTLNKEIKNDYSLNIRNEDGQTLLSWASAKGHAEITRLLLENKAKVDLANEQTGATPLTLAASNGHSCVVRLLLEHKANPDLSNEKTGGKPLGIAASNGCSSVVRLLLEHKAKVDLASEQTGATPLTLAASNVHSCVVRLLLEYKANPDLANEKNAETPLTLAAWNGHADVVRLLLEHNAKPDLVNEQTGEYAGSTPIIFAAVQGRIDIVNLLLLADVNVDFRNRKGKSALDYATEERRLETIILLLRHSAVINSPESLFNFLILSDPRNHNPDVLFALDKLIEQQNTLRRLNVADANIVLREDKYNKLKKYHNQLSKVSERLQVSRKLLDTTDCKVLPTSIVDIICKLDAPLYRLNDSDTLFQNKFHEQLEKKYTEISRSRWNPFR